MLQNRVGQNLIRTDRVVPLPSGVAPAVFLGALLAGARRNDPPLGTKQFDSVVRGRVVAGGDLNSARGLVTAYQDSRRGSGCDVGVQHGPPETAQGRPNYGRQHGARLHDRRGTRPGARSHVTCECGRVLHGDGQRQAVTDNASQSRNADDWF